MPFLSSDTISENHNIDNDNDSLDASTFRESKQLISNNGIMNYCIAVFLGE